MLKHFQVPESESTRVKADNLRSTVEELFRKVGLSEKDAVLGADVLVYADLRGVDTHGVSNMLRYYIKAYTDGTINPTPNFEIVHETPSTATIDADGALGNIVAPWAMELAIEKAQKVGSGGIAIRNSGHAGAVGYHARMAAQADMIGMAMTAGGNAMLPTFGAEAKLGTNPIAWAAPARNEEPFIFDAAMTAIAGNKIGLAARMGKPLEGGWLGNEDGSPDMEGGQAAEFGAGSLRRQLPMGGTRELGSHKGYSLGVVVDIMCGPLSAAPGFRSADINRRAHYVQAWDIAGFCDVDEFKDDMDGMLNGLRTSKPIPGEDRVLYAGLYEAETEVERTRDGIPLHNEVIDWFKSICAELSVDYTLS